MVCKKCLSESVVKNGIVRGQQRYKCKECNLNFVEGDKRVKQSTLIKKALSIILYTMSKASFNFLGKLFNCSPTQPYNWIKDAALNIEDPQVRDNIQEIEIDEMWHFVKKKLKNSGSSKPLIVAHGKQLPGLQVIVILQQLEDSTTN